MILFIISFVAGVLTILAPCTLPLLPVIVGGSIDGTGNNRKKAFTIAVSLALSIIAFTFLLKVSTVFISIPQSVWGIISGAIILLFGLVSLFPNLWENIPFMSSLSASSNKLMSTGYQKKSFWGDVIIGASLGPVFSTCSPTYFVILATVLPQSFLLGLVDLIAYTTGLGLMLLLIAFIGDKVVSRLGGLSDSHGWFKKSLGVLFILLGLSVMFGIDKKVEAGILNSGFFDITRLEQSLLRFNEKKSSLIIQSNTDSDVLVDNTKDKDTSNDSMIDSKPQNTNQNQVVPKTHGPKAPELVNPSGFINTDGKPITIGEFKGKKVILLDIWTYSCINCQRTLPYVKAWYEKYKDQGLVVIGLHTPEFAFEKVKTNVEDAARKFGLTYPIVMDNDYSTWTAYGNQYWPRKYLINENGEIIYDHIGEGNYEETEKAIQNALSELNQKDISAPITTPSDAVTVSGRIRSPEIYFGSGRNQYFGNGSVGVTGIQDLSLPGQEQNDRFYLDGKWDFSTEYTTSLGAGKMVFKYGAKNVYMVASSDKGINVTVLKDGVKQKTLFIKSNQLYTVIEGDDYSGHTLELDVPESGLNIFTLTFG